MALPRREENIQLPWLTVSSRAAFWSAAALEMAAMALSILAFVASSRRLLSALASLSPLHKPKAVHSPSSKAGSWVQERCHGSARIDQGHVGRPQLVGRPPQRTGSRRRREGQTSLRSTNATSNALILSSPATVETEARGIGGSVVVSISVEGMMVVLEALVLAEAAPTASNARAAVINGCAMMECQRRGLGNATVSSLVPHHVVAQLHGRLPPPSHGLVIRPMRPTAVSPAT